jgi:proline iminopeptidase
MVSRQHSHVAAGVGELAADGGRGRPVQQPHPLGRSAGGFVALHLAVRHPGVAGGLILVHTAPTLAPLPDADPPPSLAERGGPEAVAAAARLAGGDMSQASQEAFGRLVAPF